MSFGERVELVELWKLIPFLGGRTLQTRNARDPITIVAWLS